MSRIAVETAAKLLQARGIIINSDDIMELHAIQESIIVTKLPTYKDLLGYANAIAEQYLIAHEITPEIERQNLINGVNVFLIDHKMEPLSDQDILDLIVYQQKFEDPGTNVWDGTRNEHYGKWITQRRTPKDEFFNDRVVEYLSQLLTAKGYDSIMRYRLDELISRQRMLYHTPHDTANVVFADIVSRYGTDADEYKMAFATGTVRELHKHKFGSESKDHFLGERDISLGRKIGENAIFYNLKTPEGDQPFGTNPFATTHTSYSGADAMVAINGQIVGEIQSIWWEQHLKRPYPEGYAVDGQVICTVFDRDTLKTLLRSRKTTTMNLIFANEYGQRAYTHFTDPEFFKMQGGIDVDCIVQQSVFYFHAEDVEMQEFTGNIHEDDGTLNPLFDK